MTKYDISPGCDDFLEKFGLQWYNEITIRPAAIPIRFGNGSTIYHYPNISQIRGIPDYCKRIQQNGTLNDRLDIIQLEFEEDLRKIDRQLNIADKVFVVTMVLSALSGLVGILFRIKI